MLLLLFGFEREDLDSVSAVENAISHRFFFGVVNTFSLKVAPFFRF